MSASSTGHGHPSDRSEQWVQRDHCSLAGTAEHGEDRMADAGRRMWWVEEVV